MRKRSELDIIAIAIRDAVLQTKSGEVRTWSRVPDWERSSWRESAAAAWNTIDEFERAPAPHGARTVRVNQDKDRSK